MTDPDRADQSPPPNVSTLWGRVLVDELARCGVRWAVIAPGSRSAPLALACAAHPDVADLSVIDERSAAFVALGLARATGTPAAVISTSGTAAAHFLPALLEADRSAVPLLALTADRPARLRDAGASQTADQVKLFGDRVRWFHETAEPALAPGREEAALRALRSAACHAWDCAVGTGGPPGPVHLNVPFDKPLDPTPAAPGTPGALPEGFDPAASAGARGRIGGAPWRRTLDRAASVSGPEEVATVAPHLASALLRARRPLVLVGARAGAGEADADRLRKALARLLETLPVPIWAEAASGLRTGGRPADAASAEGPEIVATSELLLGSERFRERMGSPDLVLQLGEAPIGWAGRRFAAELAEREGVEQIAVDPWGRRRDPEHAVAHVVPADPAPLLEAVAGLLAERPGEPSLEPEWVALHLEADRSAREALERETEAIEELFDGGIFHHLARVAPEDTALVVSSSMPLREVELFLTGSAQPVDLFANRGLNGIDGVTSTALGIAIARRAAGASRTILVTGDVAFVHDLSGALAAGRLRERSDPIVVLVDNGGGAIFDHLPGAGHEPGFSRHLTTPTGADFPALARGCGLAHEAPESWEAFRDTLARALAEGGPRVIQVRTDRARTRRIRDEIAGRVAEALDRRLARPLPGATAAARTGRSRRGGRAGRAPSPMLLLHGFTGSRRDWAELRALLPGVPTLAVDLPGHGAAPAPPAGATLEAAVAACVDALDRRGIERAHLAGYSMGGRVALAFAAQHPERLAGLTLLGASPGIADGAEREARAERDRALARELEADGLEAFVDRWMALPIFATQSRLGHRRLRRARLARLAGTTHGYAASLRGMGQGVQPSFWEDLPAIEASTLLIAGEEDAKYTRLAREMAAAMPNARVEIVPDAGHAVHHEAPAAVARLIREHIRDGLAGGER